jgi:hypothetical protein
MIRQGSKKDSVVTTDADALPTTSRTPKYLTIAWVVLLADITYALTFGAHDAAILRQSLIGIIALPVLLLIQAPAFFGKRALLAAHQAR